MGVYKPKKLNSDGSLEDIKFPLDCLDGSEDLTFSEIEISDEVTATSTNLVTGKGVYNAIKNANHGYILEITASQSLNSIPYFTIPNLSTTDVANLAKAYTQQKPTFIHYTPTGSTPHYYRVDSANYDTSASSNFVAEVHIHVDIDLVKTIGESLCLEILYQSNGSTVSVRSNPNILYQTTAFFNEVNEDLPNLSGASITSIVNESIVGDITKIIGYDNNGYVETIDVISRGFNDTENWITFCWKNKIYKMTYRSGVVYAELLKAVSDADRNTWNGKTTTKINGTATDLNFTSDPQAQIGDLTSLATTEKNSLVGAINEVKNSPVGLTEYVLFDRVNNNGSGIWLKVSAPINLVNYGLVGDLKDYKYINITYADSNGATTAQTSALIRIDKAFLDSTLDGSSYYNSYPVLIPFYYKVSDKHCLIGFYQITFTKSNQITIEQLNNLIGKSSTLTTNTSTSASIEVFKLSLLK